MSNKKSSKSSNQEELLKFVRIITENDKDDELKEIFEKQLNMKISKFLKITEKELKNDYEIDKKQIPIIVSYQNVLQNDFSYILRNESTKKLYLLEPNLNPYPLNRKSKFFEDLDESITDEISSIHCEINFLNQKVFLQDVGSFNGTSIKIKQNELPIFENMIFEFKKKDYIVRSFNFSRIIIEILDPEIKNEINEILINKKNEYYLFKKNIYFYLNEELQIIMKIENEEEIWVRLSDVKQKSSLFELTNDSLFMISSKRELIFRIFDFSNSQTSESNFKCDNCESKKHKIIFFPCKHINICYFCLDKKKLKYCDCGLKIESFFMIKSIN